MSPTVDSFERKARRVRRALRRYPTLQPVINRIGSMLWRLHLARAARRDGTRVRLPRFIELDPRSVESALWRQDVLALGSTRRQRNVVGLVRGGSWDERAFPLSQLAVFDAVRRRFEDDVPWEETVFYQEVRRALAGGERAFKIQQPEDLERILAKVERLHGDVALHGYRSQRELGTGRPWDEVVVAFDRQGRPCFVDGRHRLAVARVLNLPRIPAVVAVRHERWARLATEIRTYARRRGGSAYQPYLHPDLADLPSDQGHERFDQLLAALPIRSGMLVDLGANSGYFSHRFEDVGFDCVAVERSVKEAYFLKSLRDAAGRRFQVIEGSLTEVELPPHPDVVLALNIFHHFLKTEASYRELESFLGRLQARFLFLETHLPGDRQMAAAHRNLPPDEFAEWVRCTGGFSSVRPIGTAADGRPLFLLAGR